MTVRRWPAAPTLGLVLALALGGILRFAWLGAADISGDEVGLLTRLAQRPTAIEILDDHYRQFATFKALPLSRLAALAAVGPQGPVDANRLRLASAVAGLLGVAAMAWFGFEIGGLSLAAVLAFVTALNPFHLYWSRVAHVYVFLLLFAALFYAVATRLGRRLLQGDLAGDLAGGRAGWTLWSATILAAVAAGLCHVDLWPAVLLAWGFPLAAWWTWRRHQGPAGFWSWAPVVIAPAVWLLSLVPWAMQWTTAWTAGLVTVEGPSPAFWRGLPELIRMPLATTFGGGWRTALSLGLPVLAFASPRTRGAAALLGVFALGLFLLLTLLQSPAAPSPDVYGPLWPVLLALVSLGVLAAADELRHRWLATVPSLAAAGAVLLAAVSIAPSRALLELRGRPAEYSRLAASLDELSRDGAPALFNGRSIAEFEMRPHRPSRAVPTFTVSDSGFEEWRANDWRETAEDFLRRFTDAPLVQQGRNYYEHPEVGPWAFPDAFFARRQVLQNHPAERLAALRLAPVEDFYGPRTVTEISFNRPEDLLARARRELRPALAQWGDGWLYAKTPDLRDWRVLERRAELSLHNLTTRPLPIRLLLEVYAPSGRKRLTINGVSLDVPRSDDDQQLLLRHVLAPGEETLVFEDALYDFGFVPLYVASMRVTPDADADADTDTELQENPP